jgi:hypothetical protein
MGCQCEGEAEDKIVEYCDAISMETMDAKLSSRRLFCPTDCDKEHDHCIASPKEREELQQIDQFAEVGEEFGEEELVDNDGPVANQ